MSLNDYLLLGLVQYGLPVLGAVILIASAGPPLPATLMLLVSGALVRQGELDGVLVFLVALGAALVGDQIGYSIGRWGSEHLVKRMGRLGGGAERWAKAEQVAKRSTDFAGGYAAYALDPSNAARL